MLPSAALLCLELPPHGKFSSRLSAASSKARARAFNARIVCSGRGVEVSFIRSRAAEICEKENMNRFCEKPVLWEKKLPERAGSGNLLLKILFCG